MKESDVWAACCIGITVVFALLIGVGLYKVSEANKAHEAELATHGCKLRYEAPTGKKVYCGKACFRDEKLALFECSAGYRVEIDGEWAGGVKGRE